MLLRPDKPFSPLHQLRKYLSELVQSASPFQIARTRFYQSALQSQSLVVNVSHQCRAKVAPSLSNVAEHEKQRLFRAIQQQFPIVKVFSAPSIVRPAYQLSFAKQQFRTIVSSGATGASAATSTLGGGGGGGGQAVTEGFAFCAGGGFFPRTHMVGYARTPFAARQFSTARSPCITLFQQSTTTTANTNGVSHISSRLFSPAGSKMYVPTANEAHARLSPSSNGLDEGHEELKHTTHGIPFGSRPSSEQAKLDPMTHTNIQEQEVKEEPQVLSRVAKDRKHRHHHSARRAHYDYIRHDDLSYRYTPGTQKKPVPHVRHAHWHSSHLKAPPPPAVAYLSFKLDGAPIWHEQRQLHDSQRLDALFIGSLHSVAEIYRMFLAEVVSLLGFLQRHGKFEIVMSGSHELRVVFPLSHQWPAEDRMAIASRWLSDIGIDPDNPCFSIQEMEPPPSLSQQYQHQQSTLGPSSKQGSPDNEVFGPEYFKGIQAFLNHVDQLIETGPAFDKGLK